MLGSIADVVYIAKVEVRDWPVFGILACLQATIFVRPRGEAEDRRAGERDRGAGWPTARSSSCFPEGNDLATETGCWRSRSSLFGAAAIAASASPSGSVSSSQPVPIAYTGVHGMPMGRYHRPIACLARRYRDDAASARHPAMRRVRGGCRFRRDDHLRSGQQPQGTSAATVEATHSLDARRAALRGRRSMTEGFLFRRAFTTKQPRMTQDSALPQAAGAAGLRDGATPARCSSRPTAVR